MNIISQWPQAMPAAFSLITGSTLTHFGRLANTQKQALAGGVVFSFLVKLGEQIAVRIVPTNYEVPGRYGVIAGLTATAAALAPRVADITPRISYKLATISFVAYVVWNVRQALYQQHFAVKPINVDTFNDTTVDVSKLSPAVCNALAARIDGKTLTEKNAVFAADCSNKTVAFATFTSQLKERAIDVVRICQVIYDSKGLVDTNMSKEHAQAVLGYLLENENTEKLTALNVKAEEVVDKGWFSSAQPTYDAVEVQLQAIIDAT